MALDPLDAAELAAVVTWLEMRARPRPAPLPASLLRLVRWERPATAAYRALFRRVGSRWLWFSRLAMDDTALKRVIRDPAIEVHAVVDRNGIEVGLLELDFRVEGACEIGFLGLVPELAGRGHGRWLMALALARAWAPGVARVWLHTCSLDHPTALGFYRAQGFVPFARSVERFADPRVLGILAPGDAPQIPLLAPIRAR